MAEILTGRLLFDKAKGKWRVEFFNEKKQKQSTLDCDQVQLSIDIPKDKEGQLEVQFEREPPYGNLIRVRLAGKEFVQPPSSSGQGRTDRPRPAAGAEAATHGG